jgi:hypothetical protein
MSLSNHLNVTVDYAKQLDRAFIQVYLPRLKRDKTIIYSISVAVTLISFGRYIYRKMTVPPKKYRAFPCVTYVDLLKSIFRGDTVYEQKRKLVLPLLEEANGIYVVRV